MVKSFRFADSNMSLTLLVSPTILLMFSLPLLQGSYAAESFKGLPFSVEIPDTWAYTETPEPPIEHVLGVTSYTSVILVPVHFAELLIQEKHDIVIGNGSAAIVFAKASDYSVKNAPLDLYVKYRMNEDDSLNLISRQDTIVGKEKAVRIDGSKNDTSGNIKLLEYLLLHNNEPYVIRYIAGVNEFERYLPEFELMVKSFTFRENNTDTNS
ncbi:MAG TPA: hypothetical protein VK566_04655 [Nitrososphaeraceae archaeon]|nr:hypothetical protein [Nitrososphaeraceae archaeon]